MCVALVIEHVKRMRRALFSSVACLAPQYFSTLYHKWHDFQVVKKLLNLKCVLIFCVAVVCNISHYKKNSSSSYKKFEQVCMSNTSY